MTNRTLIVLGLTLSCLVFPAASYADDRGDGDRDDGDRRDRDRREQSAGRGSADVTLYEISESVAFAPDSTGIILRKATAPLLGFAAIGTPLCPPDLQILVPGLRGCTVSANGESNVDVATGLGRVSGDFDVVINAPGNDPAHVPDLPVIRGKFDGSVDLSDAVVRHVPHGLVEGSFAITHVADPNTGQLVELPTAVTLHFMGKFRLPFGIDLLGRAVRHRDSPAHFYLADDGTHIRIRSDERSVGFPTVRLEVRFQ